jgi:hypothetical protein
MDFIRQRSQLIQRMVDFRKKQHWNSLQQKRYLLFPVSVKNEFGSCSKRNAGQITTNLSSVLCQNKFGSCSKRNAGQITTNLSSVLWLRPLAVVQNGMLDKLQRISPPSSGCVLWQLFKTECWTNCNEFLLRPLAASSVAPNFSSVLWQNPWL